MKRISPLATFSTPFFYCDLDSTLHQEASINLIAQCKNWFVTIARGHEFRACVTQEKWRGEWTQEGIFPRDDTRECNEDFVSSETRNDRSRKKILRESSYVCEFTHLVRRVNKCTMHCIFTVGRMLHGPLKRKQLMYANEARRVLRFIFSWHFWFIFERFYTIGAYRRKQQNSIVAIKLTDRWIVLLTDQEQF